MARRRKARLKKGGRESRGPLWGIVLLLVPIALLVAAYMVAGRYLVSLGWGDRLTSQEVEAAEARSVHGGMATEDWIRLLGDRDPLERRRAMAALTEKGRRAVPALIQALEDSRTAPWAALTLARIGPDARAAVPALTEIVHEEGPMWAVHALGCIGVGRREHSQALGVVRAGRSGRIEESAMPEGSPD